MEEQSPILEVRDFSISFTRYGCGTRRTDLRVIRDLQLSLYAGRITAVIGASGSGKSLLAHGILGILPYNAKSSGELRYLGEPLTEKRLQKLRGREITLVPQSVTFLDPLMKIGPQIRMGDNAPESRKKSRAVLARYGLEETTEDRYPFELSGGMARRVLISTAVMANPRLVIADEPTPGLDARTAQWILRHFREIADEGAAVLLITHDLELALTVADRIAVFYAGVTLEEASAADFQSEAALRHPYTKALWRAMPKNGFTSAAGTQPYPGTAENCPYAPRCPLRTPECAGDIPPRPLRGGMVRCIHSE